MSLRQRYQFHFKVIYPLSEFLILLYFIITVKEERNPDLTGARRTCLEVPPVGRPAVPHGSPAPNQPVQLASNGIATVQRLVLAITQIFNWKYEGTLMINSEYSH